MANVTPHEPASGDPSVAPGASPPTGLPAADVSVSWSSADEAAAARQREIAAQAAEEAHQAVGEAAEGPAEAPERQTEQKEDSKDKALVITLSTLGGVLLLVAGGVGAYYIYARSDAEGAAPPSADAADPVQRDGADAADPMLSARGAA